MEMVMLTTAQLAKRLGIAAITLQIWRSQGIGIPFFKQGTRVYYRLADVQDYERRNVDSLSAWLLGSDRPLPEMEPLPMLRAMATAMLSPPVTHASTPQPISIALPARTSAEDRVLSAEKNVSSMNELACDSALSTRNSALTPSTLAWYLIHTKPRQEALALTNLSRQGFECYMPMLRLQKIRQRKTALVAEPMFPRYLFIRLDASGSGQSWSPIRSTLGVNQLVRFGGQPAKVDGQLIDLIRSREQGTHAQPLFTSGDNVTIADGPFAGLEAIYQNTDAESRSMILLNILSKPVAMRIDTASLRKTA